MICLLFNLVFRLQGGQWIPSWSICRALSLHQAEEIAFAEIRANGEIVCFLRIRFCLPCVLPDNLRVWTSNICTWVFLLMESETELWAAAGVRVLQITGPLHSLFSLSRLSSKIKNQGNLDYPSVEWDLTFSWYKSEQLYSRFFELRIWPLSQNPVISRGWHYFKMSFVLFKWHIPQLCQKALSLCCLAGFRKAFIYLFTGQRKGGKLTHVHWFIKVGTPHL